MGILYEEFSDKGVPDKIVFMEDWITEQDNIEHISERELKGFFRKVLENENNAYIKTLTIEALVFLTIINKVRRGSCNRQGQNDSFCSFEMNTFA